MKLSLLQFATASLAVVGTLLFARSMSPGLEVESTTFQFVVLGDRTGEAVPGIYEEVWREADADRPDFVINVGDTIQGGNDQTAEADWRDADRIMKPYRKYPIFFVPGNHDVWSAASAKAYEQHSGRPLHYSFNFKQAHFTVLNNSQSDKLNASELEYLKTDLAANASQPLKFVFFHRPSWLFQAALKNPDFPLHQLALQYGVRYVISGHLHNMLHFQMGPVTYVCIASSGGHLREPRTYENGWFFQHTLVTVKGNVPDFTIKEVEAPLGQGRVSKLADWGTRNLKASAP